MTTWRRISDSLLSVLFALVISSMFLDVIRSPRDPKSWITGTLFVIIYGSPLWIIGWLLALPIVLKIRQTKSWRFWALLSLGSGIGPLVMLIIAVSFELYTLSTNKGSASSWAPEALNLVYFAACISFMTTLFFLLFLRRAQRITDSKRIGFMTGQLAVPEDFDRMHDEEIERLFDGRGGP